ncbi:MAG TPA: hypothetical protein VFL63_05605 [Rhodanobacteraceae bacterium]|nr:hypothetical protein [Rhodanobacteraceae bacterium]
MGEIIANDRVHAAQATLTFWIPERIDALLSEHERCRGVSRSDCVRAILRQYLYGLYGMPSPSEVLRPRRAGEGTRGAWGGRTPELGKNTVEVKLSLPRAWREDLAGIAAMAGITLSHCAREIVVTHVLGHVYLPARAMCLHTIAAE